MAGKNQAEIVLTARDRTKSAFSSVNRGLGRIASIGLAGAVAGTVLLTRASLKQIDALAKQSQLLGITTEKLAAFQLVSAKTGVEQKTLEKSLINVTRVVAEAAEGTGLATDTLKKLGLEAKALSQLTPDEQFLKIADAMKGLNSQSEKVLASYELFGGRGAALLRTLEAGSDAFAEAEERTKRFGTAISAVNAKTVEDANDAFTDLQESLKGVGFSLAQRFAPGMEAASNATATFLVTIRRDFIPAMALLLEQMEIVQNNVRGLSDIELAIRVEVQADKLADINERLDEELKRSAKAALHGAISREGEVSRVAREAREARRIEAVQAEAEAAESRLADVKAEQARRAEIILAADIALREERDRQTEEARIAREELELEQERESFELRMERMKEDNASFIEERLKRAAEFRRIAFAEARVEQRAMADQGRREEQAARMTVQLRLSTAQASVNILQTLVGKNKRVARALFLVEKGLAIARTVQNTAAAQMRAFSDLGPVAGAPVAAAIGAYGAVQVGLIAATALTGVSSIGGGGGLSIGAGGGGGGGGGGGDFGDDGGTGAAQTGGPGLEDQGVVQLIFPSVFGITPEVIDALADALREASENRDVIVVAGQGRNAEILQGANG